MKTTVRVLLMSQLSDLNQFLKKGKLPEKEKHLINFMKHIIATYPNTNMEIDADEELKRYFKTVNNEC